MGRPYPGSYEEALSKGFIKEYTMALEKKVDEMGFTPIKDLQVFEDGTIADIEADPLGYKPHELGAKLDSGKPAVFRGLIDYFPRACIEVARISTLGASKYAWKGWEKVPDGINRYSDALVRHLCAEAIEGPFDGSPKGLGADVLHASQVAWNALARLELILREQKK